MCWCRLKEESINSTTKALILSARDVAQKEGRTPEEVWKDIENSPSEMLPKLMASDTMKELIPESVTQVLSRVPGVALLTLLDPHNRLTYSYFGLLYISEACRWLKLLRTQLLLCRSTRLMRRHLWKKQPLLLKNARPAFSRH